MRNDRERKDMLKSFVTILSYNLQIVTVNFRMRHDRERKDEQTFNSILSQLTDYKFQNET